jgi:hypothetical protein
MAYLDSLVGPDLLGGAKYLLTLAPGPPTPAENWIWKRPDTRLRIVTDEPL